MSNLTVTKEQTTKVLADDGIELAVILKHKDTNNEFLICDTKYINPDGREVITRNVKKRLAEEKILVTKDPETKETERETTKVYEIVSIVKGEQWLKKSHKEQSIKEKVMTADEIVKKELGMTLEEAKKLAKQKGN